MTEEFRVVYSDSPWNETGGGRIKRGADRHYSLIKKKEDIHDVIVSAPEWKMLAENVHHYMWVTNNFLADGLWLMGALGFRYITNVAWIKNRFGIGRYFRGQHELCLFGVKGNGFAPETRTTLNNIRSVVNTEYTLVDSFLDAIEILHDQRLLIGWTPELDRPLQAWMEDAWKKLDAAEQEFITSQGWRTWPELADGGAIAADHVYRDDGQRKHSAKPPVFYELIESRSKGPYLELFARSDRPGWTSWGNEAPDNALPAGESQASALTDGESSQRSFLLEE